MKRWGMALGVGVAMLVAGEARATILGTPDTVSLDVRADSACVLKPAAQRDPVACKGVPDLKDADFPPQVLSAARFVLAGGAIATVSVVGTQPLSRPLDGALAKDVVKGIKDGALEKVPGGHATEPTIKIVEVAGTPVLRTSFDVTGGPPELSEHVAHQLHLVVPTRDALYSIAWTTSAGGASAVDAAADAALPTLFVARTPDTNAREAGRFVGRALVIGVAVAIVIALARRRRKAAR